MLHQNVSDTVHIEDAVSVTAGGKRPLYAERIPIHPKRVSGFFRRLKWTALVVLLGIYYTVPWIRWDRGPGIRDQAVLVALPARPARVPPARCTHPGGAFPGPGGPAGSAGPPCPAWPSGVPGAAGSAGMSWRGWSAVAGVSPIMAAPSLPACPAAAPHISRSRRPPR